MANSTEGTSLKRIYLDQNKWIDLARAATNHANGARFRDALTACRAAARAGKFSFPLDIYRYLETSKRGNERSRHDVTDIMREISRGHTMTTSAGLLDQEVDTALKRHFGLPLRVRRQKVFGLGMRHIAVTLAGKWRGSVDAS